MSSDEESDNESRNSPREQSKSEIAIQWFNGLSPETKSHIILTQYEMHMSIRDEKSKELANSLNNKWSRKIDKTKEEASTEIMNLKKETSKEITNLNGELSKLKMENDVLSRTSGFDMIKEHFSGIIKNLESTHTEQLLKLENRISGSHNNLESKIIGSHTKLETRLTSNYSKGVMGENWVENTLVSVPNCILKNVTRDKGLTDFSFEIGGLNGLIESKNVDKMNKEYIDRFKNDVLEAKQSENIDFAIFVAHRLKYINGKPFSLECLHTKRGNVFLFYVADAYNHVDRLLTAINLGQTLVDSVKFANNVEGLMYNVNVIMNRIDALAGFMAEQRKNLQIQKKLIKNSQTTIKELSHVVKTIIKSSSIKDSKKKLCIDIAVEFLKENKTFTIKDLTDRLINHNITKSNAGTLISRKLGGIKNVKKLAMEEFEKRKKYSLNDDNNLEDLESEPDSDPDSDPDDLESDESENDDSENSESQEMDDSDESVDGSDESENEESGQDDVTSIDIVPDNSLNIARTNRGSKNSENFKKSEIKPVAKKKKPIVKKKKPVAKKPTVSKQITAIKGRRKDRKPKTQEERADLIESTRQLSETIDPDLIIEEIARSRRSSNKK